MRKVTAAQADAWARARAALDQRNWELENTPHGHLISHLRQVKEDPNFGRKILAALSTLPDAVSSAYEGLSDGAMRISEWAQGASGAREDPEYRRAAESFSAQTGQLAGAAALTGAGCFNPQAALWMLRAQLGGTALGAAHELVGGGPSAAGDFLKQQGFGLFESNNPFADDPSLSFADRIERSANLVQTLLGAAHAAKTPGTPTNRGIAWAKRAAASMRDSIRNGTVFEDLVRAHPELLRLPRGQRSLLYLGARRTEDRHRGSTSPPNGGNSSPELKGSQLGALSFDDPHVRAAYDYHYAKGQRRSKDGSLNWTHKTGVEFVNGYPVFDRWAEYDLRIQLTGNRGKDFALANKAAGLEETPPDMVWHHHEDIGRMQLIPKSVHKRIFHFGGFSIDRKVKLWIGSKSGQSSQLIGLGAPSNSRKQSFRSK